MSNNLSFLAGQSYTIQQFKDLHNVESIDLIKNPKNNKTFFDAGIVSGGVSKGYESNPRISRVKGDDGEFWLLHKKGESNVIGAL